MSSSTFFSKVKMVDQCDKSVCLRNFVFVEGNQEQKSWKLFGRTCNRSFCFSVPVFCDRFEASIWKRSRNVILNK